MRYVIIGAGAIGGGIAGRLAQGSHDHPPLLIARGEQGAAIRANGLRLRTPDEDVVVRLEVAAGPSEVALRHDDVLVLATKTHQVESALADWVDQPVRADDGSELGIAGDLLPIFTALNGVAAERMALRRFARVFGVTVWMPAVHLAAGEVILRISPKTGVFVIGRYAHPLEDRDSELLETLKRDWEASTLLVHVVDEVMRWKYTKLLSNLGNAVQALLAPSEPIDEVADLLRDEAMEIYRAASIDWASDEEEALWRGDIFTIRPVAGTPKQLGGSSWQSLARGSGSIETDYLNGEVVYLARSHGLEAPLNAIVQRAARHAATTGAGVGSLTRQQLGI
jgi:2-dehydropantoate 2-reductase